MKAEAAYWGTFALAVTLHRRMCRLLIKTHLRPTAFPSWQVLDLPENLLVKFESSTYTEGISVFFTFSCL